MSVALRGSLSDFGIADVFQLVGQQRKTGVLVFTGTDDQQVELRFDRGAVVSASSVESRAHESLAVARGWISEDDVERIENLLTRETIFAVLRWSDGSFDFRTQQVPRSRTFETLLGAEQILMDGLRMVDEWQSFSELVPSEDMVFQRVGDFESYREKMGGETGRSLEQAENVFFLIDGRLKVRRVIDLSLLGSFDATRALADLHSAGVIGPIDVGSLPKRHSGARPRGLPRPDARSWIAVLLPFALLVGVAMAIHIRNATPTAAGVYPIAPTALGRVRGDYATLRVRHALEAFRFARGEWPRRLKQLSDSGLLPPEALALDGPRPYYYVARKNGAVLLAPER